MLKFDEAFYGTLRQTGAILGIVALWLLSKQLTEYAVTKVLLWLVIAGTILSLPNIGLYLRAACSGPRPCSASAPAPSR